MPTPPIPPFTILMNQEEMLRRGYGSGLSRTKEGSDAFDVGLNIAFPIIIITSVLFIVFPFLAGNCIDVSTLPPVPTE